MSFIQVSYKVFIKCLSVPIRLLSLIGISHRYISSVYRIGISHRYLSSACLIGIYYRRYLSSVDLLIGILSIIGISPNRCIYIYIDYHRYPFNPPNLIIAMLTRITGIPTTRSFPSQTSPNIDILISIDKVTMRFI